MGNTKVVCTVAGPAEAARGRGAGSGSSSAEVKVDIGIAGFSGVERKKRGGRGDK